MDVRTIGSPEALEWPFQSYLFLAQSLVIEVSASIALPKLVRSAKACCPSTELCTWQTGRKYTRPHTDFALLGSKERYTARRG